jgi:hypothetical protein
MATTRIKDLSKTATTLAADSNFVLDGSTNGTQKITTGNVKADIATSFAGDLSTYGIATLGSDNKLNPDQLPDSVTNGINFVGTADSGSDLTSTTQGDFYIVNTAFTHLSISYAVGDSAVYNGSAYVKVTPGTTQIGEGGTGASTLDGAKANLEIPDVGTAPDETPLNQHLGSLAYQSADSVSVDTLEVTDKVDGSLGVGVAPSTTVHLKSADPVIRLEDSSPDGVYGQIDGAGGSLILTADGGNGAGSSAIKLRVDGATAASDKMTIDSTGVGIGATPGSTKLRVSGGSGQLFKVDDGANALMVCDATGQVGIGTSSPGSYSASADDLVVGNSSSATNSGVTVATVGGGVGSIYFADATGTGVGNRMGQLYYDHGTNELVFGVNGNARWKLDSTGNLVPLSGVGIDFGSAAAAGRTVESGLLSDYESGTWSPVYEPISGSYATMTMDIVSAVYVKIGTLVYVSAYMRTDNVDTTGGSNGVAITGLPFTSESNNTFNPIVIGFAAGWVTNPNGGYVNPNANYIRLAAKTAVTGDTSETNTTAASFTSGASAEKNLLIFSATYRTA